MRVDTNGIQVLWPAGQGADGVCGGEGAYFRGVRGMRA